MDGCGSGSIYMEGRERLPRIKSNYTVLTFSFTEMFAEDLVGSCVGRLLWHCEAGVFLWE